MLGMVLVRSLLICTSGLGGGLAGHLLCVSGAGGSLALRDGGRRSTGSACRWPAVHWLGVSRACGPLARAVAGRRATQNPLWRGRQEWISNTNMTLCKLGASLVDHGPSPTTRVATGSRRIPGPAVAPSPCGDPPRPEE